MKKFGNRRMEFASTALYTDWHSPALIWALSGTCYQYNPGFEKSQGGFLMQITEKNNKSRRVL